MAAVQNLVMSESAQSAFPAPQQLPVMQANGVSENDVAYELAGQSPQGASHGVAAQPWYHGLVLVILFALLAVVGAFLMGGFAKRERRGGK